MDNSLIQEIEKEEGQSGIPVCGLYIENAD